MRRPVVGLRMWVATPTGRKLVRYFLASAVNVVVAEAILAFSFGVLHWSARSSNMTGAGLAALPAYWLARRWVWGRTGRSHLLKEVVPFWTLAGLSLAVTTWVAGLAEHAGADITSSRLGQTLIVTGSVFAASATLWVVRFLVLNGVLFADRTPAGGHGDLVRSPALPDGAAVSRSGN